MKKLIVVLISLVFVLNACTSAPATASPEMVQTAILQTVQAAFAPNNIEQTPALNGPTPTPEIGFARSRPAPLGDIVVAGDETIQVTNVIAPADSLVDSMNASLFPLTANQEYVGVEFSIACNKSQDQKCSGVDFQYSIVGSSGQIYNASVMQITDKRCIQCYDVFGGATSVGYVWFIVDKSETVLTVEANKGWGATLVYLQIKP
jgi:hypothetical protein